MCFSATASFVAGGALSVAGGFTLAQAKTKNELPFATIPLLFGVQQIIEGVVWLSFSHPLLSIIATYTFSMFSHVLWPILVPISVLLLETDPTRKKILYVISGIGLSVGIYLLYFILTDGVVAHVVNSSIAYHSPHLYLVPVMTLYFIATGVSSLFSSHKVINLFGVVTLVSAFIAGWFFTETFISVWCFFAAILSVLVFWHFKRKPVAVRLVETG